MASIIEAAAQRMNQARHDASPAPSPRPRAAPDFTATLPRRFSAPTPELNGDTRRPVMLRIDREQSPVATPSRGPLPDASAGSACAATCASKTQDSDRPGTAVLWRVALMAAAVGAGLMYSAMSLLGPAASQRDPARIAMPAAVAAAVTPPAPPSVSPAPEPPVIDPHEDARQFVSAWARAWSAADVDAYLAHYAPDFTPGNGLTHAQWQAQRRKRIAAARDLEIVVRDLTVAAAGAGRLTVRFRQDYKAGSYRETDTPKTLTLVKGAGGWRIAAEVAG